VCALIVRVPVKVRSTSRKWHLAKEGIDVVQREERSGVYETADEVYDAVSCVDGD
jgi:hypothetical protein